MVTDVSQLHGQLSVTWRSHPVCLRTVGSTQSKPRAHGCSDKLVMCHLWQHQRKADNVGVRRRWRGVVWDGGEEVELACCQHGHGSECGLHYPALSLRAPQLSRPLRSPLSFGAAKPLTSTSLVKTFGITCIFLFIHIQFYRHWSYYRCLIRYSVHFWRCSVILKPTVIIYLQFLVMLSALKFYHPF